MRPCSIDEHWSVLGDELHARGLHTPWLDLTAYRVMLGYLRWRIRWICWRRSS